MKKNLLVGILAFAMVFPTFAQDTSNLSQAAKLAYDWLAQEGYRPSVDGDGDVMFKASGYSMYVFNYSTDQNYLRIYCGGIKSIDMGGKDAIYQSFAALKACSVVNEKYKLVKAYMTSDGRVCLEVQSYIDATPEVSSLDTSIDFILRCINLWKEEYNSLVSD